ncbi:MAG: UbiA family prenyltransferase [Candidatus Zixiibacteriota bacterium]|jgi:4-hydroxybenzoate polyprenyltransferase
MTKERNPNVAVIGFLRLMRPADWAVAFAGAALGARLAGAPPAVSITPVAAAVAAVIAGAFVNGDWLHRRTRLLASPGNPIARGLVRPGEAKWLGFILMAVGLAGAAFFGLRTFAAALFTAAFILLVNYFFDKTYFMRNVLAAVVVIMPLTYGWLAAGGDAEPPVVAAVTAGLIAISASVFRDVETRRADEIVGRKTVASAGGRFPVIVAGAFALAAVVVSVIPYWTGDYSRRYVALVAAVGGLMLFYAVLNLRRREPDPLFAASTARMMKFLIFVYFAGVYWETLA